MCCLHAADPSMRSGRIFLCGRNRLSFDRSSASDPDQHLVVHLVLLFHNPVSHLSGPDDWSGGRGSRGRPCCDRVDMDGHGRCAEFGVSEFDHCPPRTITDAKKNGYLMLLGSDAPAGSDALQAGYERKLGSQDKVATQSCSGEARRKKIQDQPALQGSWDQRMDPQR